MERRKTQREVRKVDIPAVIAGKRSLSQLRRQQKSKGLLHKEKIDSEGSEDGRH